MRGADLGTFVSRARAGSGEDGPWIRCGRRLEKRLGLLGSGPCLQSGGRWSAVGSRERKIVELAAPPSSSRRGRDNHTRATRECVQKRRRKRTRTHLRELHHLCHPLDEHVCLNIDLAIQLLLHLVEILLRRQLRVRLGRCRRDEVLQRRGRDGSTANVGGAWCSPWRREVGRACS